MSLFNEIDNLASIKVHQYFLYYLCSGDGSCGIPRCLPKLTWWKEKREDEDDFNEAGAIASLIRRGDIQSGSARYRDSILDTTESKLYALTKLIIFFALVIQL